MLLKTLTPGGKTYMQPVPWFLYLLLSFLLLLSRGWPLISWLLWSVELTFLGPKGLWQSEMVLGRLLPTGHCAESSLMYTSLSFCEGGPSAFPRGRLQIWYTSSKRLEQLSKNIGEDIIVALFLPCSSHLYLPENRLHTLEPQFLQLPPRGHDQIT